MKVNSIASTNFGAKVNIKSIDNKKHPLLYNELLNLTHEYAIPANFRTHEVELPSVSKEIMRKLNELKIKFKSK